MEAVKNKYVAINAWVTLFCYASLYYIYRYITPDQYYFYGRITKKLPYVIENLKNIIYFNVVRLPM